MIAKSGSVFWEPQSYFVRNWLVPSSDRFANVLVAILEAAFRIRKWPSKGLNEGFFDA
jgi:hypothetical protein